MLEARTKVMTSLCRELPSYVSLGLITDYLITISERQRWISILTVRSCSLKYVTGPLTHHVKVEETCSL